MSKAAFISHFWTQKAHTRNQSVQEKEKFHNLSKISRWLPQASCTVLPDRTLPFAFLKKQTLKKELKGKKGGLARTKSTKKFYFKLSSRVFSKIKKWWKYSPPLYTDAKVSTLAHNSNGTEHSLCWMLCGFSSLKSCSYTFPSRIREFATSVPKQLFLLFYSMERRFHRDWTGTQQIRDIFQKNASYTRQTVPN